MISGCKVIAANYNTIFLYERLTGYHTSIVSTTYLDAVTLTPLDAPKTVVYYEEERLSWTPVATRGNGVQSWQEVRQEEYNKPQVNYEDRLSEIPLRILCFFYVQGYT